VVARHFGAEVIKVEPPNGGDPLRVWRELDVDGTSPWFRSIGRNKKSVTIDMRKEEGRACVFQISPHHPLLLLSTTFFCHFFLTTKRENKTDCNPE